MPLETKTGKEVAQAFRKLLKAVLTANNMTLYSRENEEKSSIVERWYSTIKNIMWKYFTTYDTQKYIDVLPCMVEKYYNIYHRSIKLTPSDACNPVNYQHLHNALYARKATKPPTNTIKNTLEELVQWNFYGQELQSNVQEIFRIE